MTGDVEIDGTIFKPEKNCCHNRLIETIYYINFKILLQKLLLFFNYHYNLLLYHIIFVVIMYYDYHDYYYLNLMNKQ